MTNWAKPVLVIGVLSLLVGVFWSTWAASACQEMIADLQAACWDGLLWARLAVPIAVRGGDGGDQPAGGSQLASVGG